MAAEAEAHSGEEYASGGVAGHLTAFAGVPEVADTNERQSLGPRDAVSESAHLDSKAEVGTGEGNEVGGEPENEAEAEFVAADAASENEAVATSASVAVDEAEWTGAELGGMAEDAGGQADPPEPEHNCVPEAELVVDVGAGAGPEVGAALAHVGDAAGTAGWLVVDVDSNVDKSAGKGHIPDTAGSIVDIVADNTVLELSQQPQLQIEPEYSHSFAD
ncbi:hypothetical protein F0562_022028 [Nyssa sinensis]|uniref:Uncharacterized protein n=1 Tax=Nyssa sinensis TaxID=561372 RepID=A0A5J5BKY5_9ASTE|nr:hypothetical protein F0562_022028 [Nyssa sinensis]